MSSAFPKRRFGRLLASFRERDFPRACYRGCSYFFMFRPHSLLASQIAPTAASKLAGQPRLLHPSRTCVVTFARIGYAIRPTTGNWRNEDFHLARFAALSAAHSSPKGQENPCGSSNLTRIGPLGVCVCRRIVLSRGDGEEGTGYQLSAVSKLTAES